MLPYSPLNKVFVKTDSRFDDKVDTQNGILLYKDTTYEPEWHVNCKAEVVTLPLEFRPDFANEGITPEVRVGDTVYVHYFTFVYDENRVTVDGQDYYQVDYHKIFAKVKDDQVIPLHGYCLVEVDNEFAGEKTKGGIIIPESLRRKKVDTYGVLRYKHPSLRWKVKEGDTVFFQKEFAYEQKIEDKDYYIINQTELQAYKPQYETN